MNTNQLVEWQRVDPENNLVEPWWTHPFMDTLKQWPLKDVTWLEFGAGRSTAWLRDKCKWVDSIEANVEWGLQAHEDCARASLGNGMVRVQNLREGVPEDLPLYMDMIPKDTQYQVVSVDGIFRNECLEWAIKHLKGRNGILIADNFEQDFVWISPAAVELMKPYEEHVFFQPGHTNHAGKPWNTRYWIIP